MLESKLQGIVFGIQYFSIHDGPGIRTSVFLKGCNMNCTWCHNPEGIAFGVEAHDDQLSAKDIMRFSGLKMTADEIMAGVLKDKKYYDNSGGGLTVTGGEPTCQFEFLKALLTAAKTAGIHTALETNGSANIEKYIEISPLVDVFLMDFKITDNQKHKTMTGISNKTILNNLRRLPHLGSKLILRCPIIPGVNDNTDHFKAIAELSTYHPNILGFEIMPYHNYGIGKAKKRGLEFEEFLVPDKIEVQSWKDQIVSFGGKSFEQYKVN